MRGIFLCAFARGLVFISIHAGRTALCVAPTDSWTLGPCLRAVYNMWTTAAIVLRATWVFFVFFASLNGRKGICDEGSRMSCKASCVERWRVLSMFLFSVDLVPFFAEPHCFEFLLSFDCVNFGAYKSHTVRTWIHTHMNNNRRRSCS